MVWAQKLTALHLKCIINSDALIDADRTCSDAARQATANAYAPHSKFLVLQQPGSIMVRSSVALTRKNASYPAGVDCRKGFAFSHCIQHRGAVITNLSPSVTKTRMAQIEKPSLSMAFAGKTRLNMKKGNNTAYALYSVHSKGKCTASTIQVACRPGIQGRSFKTQ